MGAGRKTFSYDCDTVGQHDLNFELKQRNLKRDLGGVIFMCNNSTMGECKRNLIFGLPSNHWCYVQYIRQGMPIFLYNFADKTMHGIYTATDVGAWEINPSGWTPDGAGKTRYPAQVQVQVHLECPPLSERQFRQALAANYFIERGQEKFKQELDKQQAAELCGMFRKERKRLYGDDGGAQAAATTSNGAAAAARAASAAARAAVPATRTSSSSFAAAAAASASSNSLNGAQSTASLASSAAPSWSASVSAPAQQAQQAAVQAAPQRQPQQQQQQAAVQAAAPATNTTTSTPKPGVDILSDEITALKETLAPLIARLRASTYASDGPTANALSDHLSKLDDALMACQKERGKLIKALTEAAQRVQAANASVAAATASASTSAAAAAPAAVTAPAGSKNQEVLLLSGLSGVNYLKTIDIFSPQTGTWRLGPELPVKRGYCGVASIGRFVFVLGGGSGGEAWHKDGFRLDLKTGEWAKIADLSEPRGSLACVELNGKIYGIGGGIVSSSAAVSSKYFDSVEIFDPIVNSWSPGPSMSSVRYSTAGAACEGAIYVAGGFDGKSYTNSVERLDPREGAWTRVADMNYGRGALSMAAAGGCVYAVGGFDGVTEYVGEGDRAKGFLKKIEKYDPRVNAWVPVADMANRRAYGAAFTLEDCVFAIGGMTGMVSNSDFEMYNPVENIWRPVAGHAPEPRSMGGAVVVTL